MARIAAARADGDDDREAEAAEDQHLRDLRERGEPTTVYYLHSVDHQLLYVGITLSSRGLERMHEHSVDKHWWKQVAYASMEHFDTRAEAERREALAIRELRPRDNVVRPPAGYTEYGIRLCACGCGGAAPKGGGRYTQACRQRINRQRRERAMT